MTLRLLRRARAAADAEGGDGEASEPLVVSGDVRVDGGADFPSGISARGDLTLGAQAHVKGDARVAGDLVLEEGARLEGNALVEGEARLAPGARVDGRLACRRLVLGPIARRLAPDAPAPEQAEGPEPVPVS